MQSDLTQQRRLNQIRPDNLAKLLQAYGDTLVTYARQWTVLAEDCVQEAFIELAKVEQPPNPKAWLFRVTKNKAINACRSQTRRAVHEQQTGLERNQRQQNRKCATPAGSLEVREEQEVLMANLQQLPRQQREVVLLRVWSDLTWREIGELMSLPPTTAHRQFELALKQLKRLFSNEKVIQ